MDSLIGRLTTFELSNFDNYSPNSVKFSFKAQLTLDGYKRKKKSRHVESDTKFDDDLDELEALVARSLLRGKVNTKVNFL